MRRGFCLIRTFVVIMALAVPAAVSCSGPSPNPPTSTTTNVAASVTSSSSTSNAKTTCSAKGGGGLPTISTTTTTATGTNTDPFGVPKDKTGGTTSQQQQSQQQPTTSSSLPAFAKSTATATATRRSVAELRGGGLVEPSTSSEVDEIVKEASINELLVVIDFTASWCGPCKAIAPLYKEMSEEYDTVIFLKVDVDEDPDTAAKYSVSAMPTFLFVKGGKVIDRLQGANPQKLRSLIEENM